MKLPKKLLAATALTGTLFASASAFGAGHVTIDSEAASQLSKKIKFSQLLKASGGFIAGDPDHHRLSFNKAARTFVKEDMEGPNLTTTTVKVNGASSGFEVAQCTQNLDTDLAPTCVQTSATQEKGLGQNGKMTTLYNLETKQISGAPGPEAEHLKHSTTGIAEKAVDELKMAEVGTVRVQPPGQCL